MEWKNLKILIVDDDDDDVFLVQELIRDGMADLGVHIDSASSADKARALIRDRAYDVCLLDYGLGEVDGLDFLKWIRREKSCLPIIFLTGRGDQETAVLAMKEGATDYLVKANLSADSLTHAIVQAIRWEKEEKDRKQTQEVLQTQDRLLQGVSEATNRLLTLRDHQAAIQEALDILGKAMEIDFAAIYQHMDSTRRPASFVECFSWNRESAPKKVGLFLDESYEGLGLDECQGKLRTGKLVTLEGRHFPKACEALFGCGDLVSLTFVPIIIEASYWGFMVFGDLRSERRWSRNEESMLRAVASCMGSEIRRHNDEEAFHSIVQGTSSRVGDDFFQSLVRHLASALPVRYAYVSELLHSQKSQCAILAGWEGDNFLDKRTYDVVNTPYEEVLAGMMSYHPDDAEGIFIGDPHFSGTRAKSYAAVPCFDSSCKIIGYLSVVDEKPMANKQRTLSILKVFAARAGAEIERKRTEGLIRTMAYHDALTGLPNRILLSDRLEMALAYAKRNHCMLAVLFLDFDQFKNVNDSLGHDVGDQLLRAVAGRLRKCLRKQDTVARLGGDEFILLLPEVSSGMDAGHLAQKILDTVRIPYRIGKHDLTITVSIGIALYPRDGQDSNLLLKHADEALYLAKKEGKNCYHFYESDHPPRFSDKNFQNPFLQPFLP